MSDEAQSRPLIHYYFVDEAGDMTLFGRRGKVLVGTEGCSHCFMLGVAHLPNPEEAHRKLAALRADLLADPYFRNVPSMQPAARKTAITFHAKDDLPEVRREVFKLIDQLDVKFQGAFRRKTTLVHLAPRASASGRMSPSVTSDGIYDDLVAKVFKHMLHIADENRIEFARRGKSARIAALATAIEQAKRNFTQRLQEPQFPDKPVLLDARYPSESAGLQVVDYLLWALQRFVEKGESRFFEALRPAYRLVMDLDDQRQQPDGELYSESNPLTAEKLKAL